MSFVCFVLVLVAATLGTFPSKMFGSFLYLEGLGSLRDSSSCVDGVWPSWSFSSSLVLLQWFAQFSGDLSSSLYVFYIAFCIPFQRCLCFPLLLPLYALLLWVLCTSSARVYVLIWVWWAVCFFHLALVVVWCFLVISLLLPCIMHICLLLFRSVRLWLLSNFLWVWRGTAALLMDVLVVVGDCWVVPWFVQVEGCRVRPLLQWCDGLSVPITCPGCWSQ